MKLRHIKKRAQCQHWARGGNFRWWCKWTRSSDGSRARAMRNMDFSNLELRVLAIGTPASTDYGVRGGPSLQQIPRRLADEVRLVGTDTGRWRLVESQTP